MKQEVMGIINLSENEDKISGLAEPRPIAAIPFGARYRIIDFMVSNMVNSGINKIAIFTRDKFRSLQDHFGSGKYWNLDRKREGLFMMHPMLNEKNSFHHYGDLESFKDNIDFFEQSTQKYVILTRSYTVFNMDFTDAIKAHKKSKADMTIISKPILDGNEGSHFIGLDTLNIDEEGKVKSIGLNFGSLSKYNLSMEIYIMKRKLLIDIISKAVASGLYGNLKQAIIARIPSLDVRSFAYEGEINVIYSTATYFKANMDLLRQDYSKSLFEGGRIYTKIKDEAPTKYGMDCKVHNSIVANGCIIDGTVENSILFRGVEVKAGAIVRNCVIMQDTVIGENAKLNYVITDKKVTITENQLLMGNGGIPYLIDKGKVV